MFPCNLFAGMDVNIKRTEIDFSSLSKIICYTYLIVCALVRVQFHNSFISPPFLHFGRMHAQFCLILDQYTREEEQC